MPFVTLATFGFSCQKCHSRVNLFQSRYSSHIRLFWLKLLYFIAIKISLIFFRVSGLLQKWGHLSSRMPHILNLANSFVEVLFKVYCPRISFKLGVRSRGLINYRFFFWQEYFINGALCSHQEKCNTWLLYFQSWGWEVASVSMLCNQCGALCPLSTWSQQTPLVTAFVTSSDVAGCDFLPWSFPTYSCCCPHREQPAWASPLLMQHRLPGEAA